MLPLMEVGGGALGNDRDAILAGQLRQSRSEQVPGAELWTMESESHSTGVAGIAGTVALRQN